MPGRSSEHDADVLIVGGGVGGCAAALAATALGCRAILTDPYDWIGGQLTSQGVPPDEHRWIEEFGCTRRYRRFRDGVRGLYRSAYPLSASARDDARINPGGGWVSNLCVEPRISWLVLQQMLAPAQSAGLLRVMTRHTPTAVDAAGGHVRAVTLRHCDTGDQTPISARYVLDATELGDVLPLAGVEYVTGAEAQSETGEAHAPTEAQPGSVQAFTWCFALGYDPECRDDRHVIDKPAHYDQWRDYVPNLAPAWPGRLLDFTYANPVTLQPRTLPLFGAGPGQLGWFGYRQIIAARHLDMPGAHDVTLVNWPQNDYWEGNLIDVSGEEARQHLDGARQLSLALCYWLQTEAPRDDGGTGYRGLHLRPEVMGTADGLAQAPYVRESRRIRAETTVREQDVTGATRRVYDDSVGIGHYRIDLHPSTGGDNYIDIDSAPFQIPLGALIPVRAENLLPACKNIGVTHITNGCYRLHPVEWTIGEAAGALAAFCLKRGALPRQVRGDASLLQDFQRVLVSQGFELAWPDL